MRLAGFAQALQVIVGAALLAPPVVASEQHATVALPETCSRMPEVTLYAPCGAPFRARVLTTSINGQTGEIEVARSGSWQVARTLTEPKSATYSDYASGVSITINKTATGRPLISIMGLERHYRVSPPEQTTEKVAILGRTCTVWITRISIFDDRGLERHDCVTSEGIPLLSNLGLPRPADALRDAIEAGLPIHARVEQLDARAVDVAEVRPPATTFRWSTWGIGRVPADPGAKGYEVRLLDNTTQLIPRTITIRRLGLASLSMQERSKAVVSMSYSGRDASVHYSADDEGRPRRLDVRPAQETLEKFKRSANGRTEKILGEDCSWQEPDYGLVLVADAYYEECRTADGVPLAIHRMSRGRDTMMARATFVRRGGIKPKDLVPPAELISESMWLHSR